MNDGSTTVNETPVADIQVVDRSAQILRMFSNARRSIRIADVAERLGVGRTTAHRYLASLATAGFLVRDDERGYGLGPLLTQVGALALNGLDVVEIADPYLRELADVAAETSVMAVWGGRSPVVVRSHVPQTRILNIAIRVGQSLNLDAAQSAVFQAYRRDVEVEHIIDQFSEPQARRIRERIAHVRSSGLAISDTVNVGARVIAAPVLDRQARLVATVGIIGTVHTLPADADSGQVRALRDTARALSMQLGHDG